MRKLILCILVMVLSGCAGLKCDYAVIPQSKPLEIDPRLFVECNSLVAPSDDIITPEIILSNTVQNKTIHVDCMNKVHAVIVELKKITNNP